MNYRILFIFVIVLISWTACQQDEQRENEKSITEIRQQSLDGNARIVRNPITASGVVDTVNVAKIAFQETEYNFGEVKEGEVVRHTFSFTNTGKVPLIINHARSTCGCTIPDWPKQPIAPGETGKIKVQFDTNNKLKQQEKPIIIMANTYPSESRIYLKGYVK